MRRRDFLRALAGVVAVPAVIERLVAEPEVWDDHETHLRAHRSFTTTSELDRLMKEVYSQPLLDDIYNVPFATITHVDMKRGTITLDFPHR